MANAQQQPYQNQALPVEERVNDLLSRMTLEEKVAQMSAFWNIPENCDQQGNLELGSNASLLKHGIGAISKGNHGLDPKPGAIFMNNFQKYLLENTRLAIPALAHEEALRGLLAAEATSFPQALGLGSTWDVDLIEEIFTAVAKEARSRGINHVLAPVFDVARDARWGRTEEMWGEDPYLVSRIGVASVFGLQGRNMPFEKDKVIATGKHFAAHGQPEGGFNGAPANAPPRMLREVYLMPFKAAVKEAGLYSIMSAYTEIDGIPCHANKYLLNDVLRDEWGFKGFVVSDYSGIQYLVTDHSVKDATPTAALKALNAGIDMELPRPEAYPFLIELVKSGKVKETQIDKAVERILRAKFLLGLFENPYVDVEKAINTVNSKEHQALALKAAHKAIILLKNQNNLLPLTKSTIKNIAVIGPNAAKCHSGGYGRSPSNAVSILEGIKREFKDSANVHYAEGCGIVHAPNKKENWNNIPVFGGKAADSGGVRLYTWEEDSVLIAEAVETAKKSDVAILVVGENELTCREGWPGNLGDRDDLNLIGNQDKLVKTVVETGVPTVVVLIHGRPNSINYIAENVPAILEGWYLGQETGTAVADVLVGRKNPGGKLTISIPRNVGQLPVYYSKKPSGTGNMYYFSSSAPLFPFGFGLSYTSFEYSKLKLSKEKMNANDTLVVSFDITNTGKYEGDEIAQLYLRDINSFVTRPVKELKDFKRVELKPGESKTVHFHVDLEKLSFVDQNMKWTAEPGFFDVMIGSSSDQIRLNGKFEFVDVK
jgi:beta-glucosidase